MKQVRDPRERSDVLRRAEIGYCYNAALLADARSHSQWIVRISTHKQHQVYIHTIICTCASVPACQADTSCVQVYR